MVERLLVVVVAAGDDEAVGRRRQLGASSCRVGADVADEPALGRREALAAGVALAVVEHPDVEIDLGRQPGDRLADVAAADDEQRDARQDRQVGDAVPASPGAGRCASGARSGE